MGEQTKYSRRDFLKMLGTAVMSGAASESIPPVHSVLKQETEVTPSDVSVLITGFAPLSGREINVSTELTKKVVTDYLLQQQQNVFGLIELPVYSDHEVDGVVYNQNPQLVVDKITDQLRWMMPEGGVVIITGESVYTQDEGYAGRVDSILQYRIADYYAGVARGESSSPIIGINAEIYNEIAKAIQADQTIPFVSTAGVDKAVDSLCEMVGTAVYEFAYQVNREIHDTQGNSTLPVTGKLLPIFIHLPSIDRKYEVGSPEYLEALEVSTRLVKIVVDTARAIYLNHKDDLSWNPIEYPSSV